MKKSCTRCMRPAKYILRFVTADSVCGTIRIVGKNNSLNGLAGSDLSSTSRQV